MFTTLTYRFILQLEYKGLWYILFLALVISRRIYKMASKELFIFDMDGVLLESEPFWRTAQIETLATLGVTISVDDCIRHTMGKRLEDMAKLWTDMFSLDIGTAHLAQLIVNQVVLNIGLDGKANEGLYSLIEFLRSKNYRIALATSSCVPIISAVIKKLDLNNVFELMVSADEVPNGKPAPDVYLEVCRRIGVPTTKALALEDSLTGVRSAVAAGITTIAIPEFNSKEFVIADHVINKLQDAIDIAADYFK